MDLSKKAKQRRDAVEGPLFRVADLIEYLDEIRVRIDAVATVWPDTKRTLIPASAKLDATIKDMSELKEELSHLWQKGFETKWNEK